MRVKTAMIVLGVALAAGALVGVLLLGRFLARGLGAGTQADAPRRRASTDAQRGTPLDGSSRVGPAR
jgi:hypothetical protein